MRSAVSSPVLTNRRPIPLQARRDLQAAQVTYQGVTSWIIKDPLALEYYRLQAEQYHVLQLLDGQRSAEQIRAAFQQEFPTQRPTLRDIRQLVADLHHKGLVYSNRPGQGDVLIDRRREKRRQQFLQAIQSVLYIKLPGWDPESTLQRLYPLVRQMFRPSVQVLLVLFVVVSWGLLAVHVEQFQRRLPEFHQFFGWPNLLWLWVTMGAAKMLHELAHGLSCKHHGGECHEIGVALLVFSPCLYCDVSDSWLLADKWKRIRIAAAGMGLELVLSGVALFAWRFTQPGLLHHLCLNVFFVTTLTTVIFNANPLLRYDGYYILSDWLEIPNLRPKADRMLKENFAKHCLGVDAPPDPFMPQTKRAWFVLYSMAAAVYRWFLLFAITFMLYRVLKPYGLKNLGLLLGVFSAVTIVGHLLYHLGKLISAPRSKPMSYRRIAVTLVVAAGTVAAGLLIPVPWHVQAPFVIEPTGIQHVYTSTPGQLAAVYVRPGQRVQQGDVLVRLSHFVKEDGFQRLRTARDVQRIELDLQKALGDPARQELAAQTLRSIETQLIDYEEQLRGLVIVAPCDGIVTEPPEIRPSADDDADKSLHRWQGTPLDARNLGCWLSPRTRLLSIAPEEDYQAVLLIDQADRNDVAAGQNVELKFEHRPGEVYGGMIGEIADGHLEIAPKALSNKYGGDLPTVTDPQGRERLTSVAYQATVPCDHDTALLRPGIRGVARCVVDSRTVGQWMWRFLRRTVHFRM